MATTDAVSCAFLAEMNTKGMSPEVANTKGRSPEVATTPGSLPTEIGLSGSELDIVPALLKNPVCTEVDNADGAAKADIKDSYTVAPLSCTTQR